jgi:hypothetical protein
MNKKIHIMKKLLIACLTIILFSCTPVQSQNTDIDIADTNTLTFKKLSTGNAISLSASAASVTTAFGSPVSISEEVSEMDDLTYTKWAYSGMTIYFESGKLRNTDITSTSIGLVFNNVIIKVGSDINNLSSLFPGSFALRSDDDKMLKIGLHHNEQVTDAQIVIGFNLHDKVTYISLIN